MIFDRIVIAYITIVFSILTAVRWELDSGLETSWLLKKMVFLSVNPR
jgi:hypothetical protein